MDKVKARPFRKEDFYLIEPQSAQLNEYIEALKIPNLMDWVFNYGNNIAFECDGKLVAIGGVVSAKGWAFVGKDLSRNVIRQIVKISRKFISAFEISIDASARADFLDAQRTLKFLGFKTPIGVEVQKLNDEYIEFYHFKKVA